MSNTQRGSLKGRVLKAPLLNFSIEEKITQLKKETAWIEWRSQCSYFTKKFKHYAWF